MYSNNIVNIQESTTILNACTKKIWELIEGTTNIYIYFIKLKTIYIYMCVCVCVCVCVSVKVFISSYIL